MESCIDHYKELEKLEAAALMLLHDQATWPWMVTCIATSETCTSSSNLMQCVGSILTGFVRQKNYQVMSSRHQLGRSTSISFFKFIESICMYHVTNILVFPTFSLIGEAFVFIPRSGSPLNEGKSHPIIKNLNDYNLILNVHLKADCFRKQLVSSSVTLISSKHWFYSFWDG